MIYTEHSLAKKLKDVSVSEYKPNWNKQEVVKQIVKTMPKVEVKEEKQEEIEEISLDNF